MEFSRIEDDTIYIKGTEQDKNDIILLMNSFKKEFEAQIHTYTNYEANEIQNVKIEVADDFLIITKNDFKIIFGCFTGMANVGYYGEHLGLSKQKFLKTGDCLDKICDIFIGK